jgi:hypothetical protein
VMLVTWFVKHSKDQILDTRTPDTFKTNFVLIQISDHGNYLKLLITFHSCNIALGQYSHSQCTWLTFYTKVKAWRSLFISWNELQKNKTLNNIQSFLHNLNIKNWVCEWVWLLSILLYMKLLKKNLKFMLMEKSRKLCFIEGFIIQESQKLSWKQSIFSKERLYKPSFFSCHPSWLLPVSEQWL